MAERRGRDALEAALDRRAEAGNPVVLWWRDDDATRDTPALRRLVGLGAAHGLAPVIAAIPGRAGSDLGAALEPGAARVAVHGIAHRNEAGAGEKKCELGGGRDADAVLADLAAARMRLRAVVPGRLIDILVPPWNRIAPAIAARLGEAGFRALSVFGRRQGTTAGPGVAVINTHVDIIDWRGTRGGRAGAVLFGEIARLVGAAPDADREPLGVLTHHLVHDAAAWNFLADLFTLTAAHPGARWCAPGRLIAAAGKRGASATARVHG